MKVLVCLLLFASGAIGYHNRHLASGRSGIVHLFEWKFKDIANECEQFLAPHGYGGVQVSPVSENVIVEKRPWWERYQPISYLISTRSGDENDFRDMTRRCNAVGVRIYADVIINHMNANHQQVLGTAGSRADVPARVYPAVPYNNDDFHPTCEIRNYENPNEVRNCELVGLPDLDQSKQNVRDRIGEFLSQLVDIGVAGFRIDAAKHMRPADLAEIYKNIKNLSTSAGFSPNSRPFIYQEVIDLGTEPIKKTEYIHLGAVTEFGFSAEIGKLFRGDDKLKKLSNWGTRWGFLPSRDAIVFVDNHDNQRGHGAGGASILTHKNRRQYILANAFMLAHSYGLPRIMSSYEFEDTNQGPPADSMENIISPGFDSEGQCVNGWVCEHRWPEIVGMIGFRNAVQGTYIMGWWDNGRNQIAFCRNSNGFIAFNNDEHDMDINARPCVPPGTYCDVISGKKVDNRCTGRNVTISPNGLANIKLTREQGVLAIHVESKLH